MKLTDIFKFKLFERTDPVDMEIVNENFESVEKLFKGLDQVDNTSDCDKNVASAKKAECDGNGKNISETYLKKTAVANNNTTTEAGFALDARQANPNVDGSLAKQIIALNDGLANKHFIKIMKSDWSGIMGSLMPMFNINNDNITDLIAHNEQNDTYPAVRVARASADYNGNNISDTYLKKVDAKNNVSGLSNTMTNYNDQTPVVQYFIVPDDGYYLVTGLVTFSSNANGFREVFITNTTSNYVMGRVRVPAISGDATTLQVTSGGTFGPGQTGTLSTYQNSGSNLNVQEWLSMVKIAPKL